MFHPQEWMAFRQAAALWHVYPSRAISRPSLTVDFPLPETGGSLFSLPFGRGEFSLRSERSTGPFCNKWTCPRDTRTSLLLACPLVRSSVTNVESLGRELTLFFLSGVFPRPNLLGGEESISGGFSRGLALLGSGRRISYRPDPHLVIFEASGEARYIRRNFVISPLAPPGQGLGTPSADREGLELGVPPQEAFSLPQINTLPLHG